MGGADIRTAIEGVRTFFEGRPTHPAVVARRLLGRPESADAALSEHLIRKLRRQTRIDGSLGGVLHETARGAWELMELGCMPDSAGLVRMTGYLLSQQSKPGHFGEGCSPDTHAQRRCHHFLSGCFSPGGRDNALAPLTLPAGAKFEDENEARLAASLLTLRTVLRAGEDRRPGVRDHVAALLNTDLLDDVWVSGGTPDLFFLLVGAIAYGPPQVRAEMGSALATLIAHQNPDGAWPGANFFHALDMLAGVTAVAARPLTVAAASRLCNLQRPSGAFDDQDNEERTLIGARTLITACQGLTTREI